MQFFNSYSRGDIYDDYDNELVAQVGPFKITKSVPRYSQDTYWQTIATKLAEQLVQLHEEKGKLVEENKKLKAQNEKLAACVEEEIRKKFTPEDLVKVMTMFTTRESKDLKDSKLKDCTDPKDSKESKDLKESKGDIKSNLPQVESKEPKLEPVKLVRSPHVGAQQVPGTQATVTKPLVRSQEMEPLSLGLNAGIAAGAIPKL